MVMLAGLLLADSCDDVNHENYPDVERMNRYRRQGIADEKLKEYRESLCESTANCIWTPSLDSEEICRHESRHEFGRRRKEK